MLYMIEAVSGADPVKNRDHLGHEIAALAKTTGAEIWFHEIVDPVGGAPVILLEADDAFLKSAKSLAHFGSSTAYSWPFKTTRSQRINDYFMKPAQTLKPKAP